MKSLIWETMRHCLGGYFLENKPNKKHTNSLIIVVLPGIWFSTCLWFYLWVEQVLHLKALSASLNSCQSAKGLLKIFWALLTSRDGRKALPAMSLNQRFLPLGALRAMLSFPRIWSMHPGLLALSFQGCLRLGVWVLEEGWWGSFKEPCWIFLMESQHSGSSWELMIIFSQIKEFNKKKKLTHKVHGRLKNVISI